MRNQVAFIKTRNLAASSETTPISFLYMHFSHYEVYSKYSIEQDYLVGTEEKRKLVRLSNAIGLINATWLDSKLTIKKYVLISKNTGLPQA